MNNYQKEIKLLQEETILKDNIEVLEDNLIVKLSTFVTVTFHRQDTVLDMYINNNFFGDVSKSNILVLLQTLMKEDKVFIEYRKPKGLYMKEYFKIMEFDEFKKKQRKLLTRRGTKIYTHTKILVDLY